MAMFRKLFYRKPPEGLLEISDRVYVFDCCFTTGTREEDKNYKQYIGTIIGQLKDHFPDASFLVFNFRPTETESLMSKILSEYDMTIMDYPCHYNGCPLLSIELINHFLRSTESWFGLQPQNVLLMHCETGGWAVLAFMLAALLLYRNQYTGERRTLDMVYKQAPHELLPVHSKLNPFPSQLRYLQYVARRNVGSEWPPVDKALNLSCVIMGLIPNFDGEGGCRPLFRIYGQDPLDVNDRNSKLLFETAKNSKSVRSYKQAESEIIKIDINCNLRGDIMLDCFHVDDSMEREETMFRVMFNTAFIRSNILILNRDEVDTIWHAADYFPKDFRAEILFSDMDAVDSVVKAAISSCFEEKEGLPVEAFAKVQEFFSHVDWLDSRADAALTVLQKISETHSSDKSDEEGNTPKSKSSPHNLKEEQKHKPLPRNLEDKLQLLSIDASKRKEEDERRESEATEQPDRSFHSIEELVDSSHSMEDIGVHVRKDPHLSSDTKTKDVTEVASSSTSSYGPQSSLTSPSSSVLPRRLVGDKAFHSDTIVKDKFQSSTTPQPSDTKNFQSKIQPPPPPSHPLSSPTLSSSTSPPSSVLPRSLVGEKAVHSVTIAQDNSHSSITKNLQSKNQPPPPPPPPPPPSSSNTTMSWTPSDKKTGLSGSFQTPPPPPPPPLPLPPIVSSTKDSVKSESTLPKQSDMPSKSTNSAPPPPLPPSLSQGAVKPGSANVPAPPPSLKNRGPLRSLGPKIPQTKKLKPLHWMKLNRAVKGSLWAETQKSGDTSVAPEIDMSELESLFSATVPTSGSGPSGGNSSRSIAQPKTEKVQLIDTRRACNCEIMLSKVKAPTNELMSLVLTLDESAMDADQVDNLIKFCPTKEEMDLLKGYNGERDKLGKCEQFFLTLMQVLRVEAKLRVYSFKLQFRTQIRNSAKLKRIMQTILSLGNALNQGTARGSAVGFRLDSLLKLNETRARNNKMTLMNYLCKVINEKLPEVLDFSNDLTSMEPASKVQLKILAEEMQSISKGLENVLQEFSQSENDGPQSVVFRKNLKEFICFAEEEVKSLASLYTVVGRNVDALIIYFGEDPARCSFEQVVSTLLNFTRMFNQAQEQNLKQMELDKKKKKKVEKGLGKQ
ncbi:hypothetical protein V2J09_002935 [Rumex salicifolius]